MATAGCDSACVAGSKHPGRVHFERAEYLKVPAQTGGGRGLPRPPGEEIGSGSYRQFVLYCKKMLYGVSTVTRVAVMVPRISASWLPDAS